MAKEDIKIRLPVVPELDRRSTSNLIRDVRKLEKDLGKVNVSYKDLAKSSALNIKELRTLSDTAQAFGKNLTKSTQDSVKELSRLGKHLDGLAEKAEQLEVQISGASDEAEKSKLQDQFAENAKLMQSLNKAIDKQRDQFKKFSGEFGKAIDQQKKFKASLEKSAEFGSKDMNKGLIGGLTRVFQGNLKGGLKDIVGTAYKGRQGSVARREIARGEKMGGAEGAAHMAQAGQKMAASMESAALASAGLAMGAAAIMAFVKLIMEASNHMATLNKAVLQGKGLANEYGTSAAQFTGALKTLRNAAMDSHGSLLKFGMSSESAMEAVGAFGKEATGSLTKTVTMLKSMGGGDVQQGLVQFSRNAQVYGSALGMTAVETAKLMGNMVSDIGIDSDNIQKTLGDVVKQASQAGMPVHKFMDVFHQAVPNLDMFTNRIEELTGMMKLLSKTMDPRQVKGFMSTMSRGFDQMDFKQRLKMNLVSGGKVAGTMRNDVGNMAATLKQQMPEMADAIGQAMAGKRSFADVAAEAMAKGMTGTQVSKINELGRYSSLAGSGDVLKQTTGMRSMSMMARMKTLEDHAMSLHGNRDLAGLGEHVAKQLGISEDEYKAIVGLRQSMDTYSASIAKTGRTSSKSINDNLKKMLKIDRASYKSDEEFEQAFEQEMRRRQKETPGAVEEMVKLAATQQMEQQAADAEKAKDELMSMEDLQAEQVNATQSLGDKIENIIKVLLEKIYYIINDVFSVLDRIYTMLPGWITGDTSSLQKQLDARTSAAQKFRDVNPKGTKLVTETNNRLTEMLRNGANANKILSSFTTNYIAKADTREQAKEQGDRLKTALAGILDGDELKEFVNAANTGDTTTTSRLMSGFNAEQAALFTSRMAEEQAKGMAGQGIDYGTKDSRKELATKKALKQKELADATGDLDQRTLAQYGGAGGAAAAGAASAPGASVRNPVSFTRDQKASAEAHQTTAEATEAMADKLKKGVALDSTYTQGKLKTTLKESSLDAMRKALGEQSIFEAMMREDPEWQKALVGKGSDLMAAGFGMSDILGMRNTGAGKTADEDIAKALGAPGYALGGPTGGTPHMALMHPSEFVVPKNGALVMREGGRGGGRSVHVANLTVNIQTNNPHEVRQAIDDAFNTGG